MAHANARAATIKRSIERSDEMLACRSSSHLLELPTEITLQIFSELGTKTLAQLDSSCHMFGSKCMSMAAEAGVARANAKGGNLRSVSPLYLCEMANNMYESVNAGQYGAMRQVTKRPP